MRTGKRQSPWGKMFPFPVHPRAYGEEQERLWIALWAVGSPPCVRGREKHELKPRKTLRFTPVRTGKSRGTDPACSGVSVHPRAYGEERNSIGSLLPAGGSPPCVRGRGRSAQGQAADGRFTPVRTGKRACHWRSVSRLAVHPRAYGEERCVAHSRHRLTGSPPCVRGREPIMP